MPRFFAGRTNLGRVTNSNSRQAEDAILQQYTKKRALLRSCIDQDKKLYYFMVETFKSNGELSGKLEGPIKLFGTPLYLNQTFGTPEEMENNYMVVVEYFGSTLNKDGVKIIGGIPGTDREESELSGELLVKGTAFAPPGSSMI